MVFGFSMWATPNKAFPMWCRRHSALCFPAPLISALIVIHPRWAVLARSGSLAGAPNSMVLATQAMRVRKPPQMRLTLEGTLGEGVYAKDVILYSSSAASALIWRAASLWNSPAA